MSTASAAPITCLRDPAKPRMVLTALYIAQEQYGHLSEEALERVAERLGLPLIDHGSHIVPLIVGVHRARIVTGDRRFTGADVEPHRSEADHKQRRHQLQVAPGAAGRYRVRDHQVVGPRGSEFIPSVNCVLT